MGTSMDETASGRESARQRSPRETSTEPLHHGNDGGATGGILELIEDVDVKKAVDATREGTLLLKHCRSKLTKPHQRLFWMDMEVLALKWTSPSKSQAKTTLWLTNVDKVYAGYESEFWKNRSEAERSLGVELISNTKKKLRFGCPDQNQWKIWMRVLLYAHQKAITKRKRAGSLTDDFIKQQWDLADIDQSGSIQFNELILLLQSLKCSADLRYAEQLFDSFDNDGSHVLEYDEFKTLINILFTHEDAMFYFERYRTPQSQTVSEESFQAFLHEVQMTPPAMMEEAIDHFRRMEAPFTKDRGLTALGFNQLVTSEVNAVAAPTRTRLFQDMRRPLSEYWIATSRLTCQTGDTGSGKEAVSQLARILHRGCRCIEIELWNGYGTHTEPAVFYGELSTSRVPFKAIVEAIKEFGFTRSPWPLILHIILNCTPDIVLAAGEVLRATLGKVLYVPQESDETLPSPMDLQRKVVVMSQVVDGMGIPIPAGNEEDAAIESACLKIELMADYPDKFPSKQVPNHLVETAMPMPKLDLSRIRTGSKRGSAARLSMPTLLTEVHNEKLQEGFYKYVAIKGNALEELNSPRAPSDVALMNEQKLQERTGAGSSSTELRKFTQRNLCKVYSKGTGLMSPNLLPTDAWNLGVQMVAVNYQAFGMAALLNYGRFRENGGCGFVLKPAILQEHQGRGSAPDEASVILTLRVLAGQQLPRPTADGRLGTPRRKDTARPFVVVSLQGIKEDCVSFKTGIINNNGLNPRWRDQVFQFFITSPSLSILVLEVRHQDPVFSEFLGAAAIPISCARPGLRWVGICDERFRNVQWSGVLVHVALKAANSRLEMTPLVYPPVPPVPMENSQTSNFKASPRRTL